MDSEPLLKETLIGAADGVNTAIQRKGSFKLCSTTLKIGHEA